MFTIFYRVRCILIVTVPFEFDFTTVLHIRRVSIGAFAIIKARRILAYHIETIPFYRV